jgi:penicillin-binding protein 1A
VKLLKNKEILEIQKEFKAPKKHFLIILLIIIVLSCTLFTFSYFNWKSLASTMILNTPSIVLDSDGNTIANIGSERISQNVNFEDIPDNLKNAYVAIEDQRYYKHGGIDIKRTVAAIGSYVIHLGNSSFGGSSITQQLVKNLTGNNSNSVSRKVAEWIKAIQLEMFLSKDEILATYLNIIYTGPNIYGVQKASEYYFSKDVSDLSLAECAYLAGLNISPNSFNPFGEKDNSEKIENRVKTVLNKMKELNYITEDEYAKAIEETESGLNFKQTKLTAEGSNTYSYHTDAMLDEIIEDLCKTKHISTSFAENYLTLSGLTIQSTQNSNIQNATEKEFEKSTYILKSNKIDGATSQAAMVIIDHTNGQVLGCVGGLGEKTEARSLNRATSSTRQTGSAGKPISVLVPGFCEGEITGASVFVDVETTFDDGTEEGYTPTDYNGFQGAITVRRAVESSQNIPFVKIMEKITPATSIKYMKKMGITTLTKADNNLNLALGGLDKGISPLELAGAYATIANDGTYIEPTFYIDIQDSNGNTVLKTSQKTKRVFNKEIAYVIKELLTQPVKGTYGTATYCSISNIETSAKTGTTNDNYDRWLCGFTPYYTAVTWYGFDMNETIEFNGKNPAGLIWSNVMKNIHKDLQKASFEKPANIEEATICPTSGKVANSNCKNTYTEYFIKGTIPEICTIH